MDILMEKAELEQLAPTSEEVFTNAELADRLGKVQEGLLQMLLAAGFAENVAPRDMTAFLGILADKYGLKEDPDFLSLCSGTKQLGFQIASLKRGAAGERRTRDGLRNLEFIPGVKILYNVTLDNGSERTEYDAIVLTPFGNRLQAEVNAAFAADDPMMTALVSDGEISAMADRLADRYAGYIKQAASNLLAGIDRDVDDFIGSRPLETGQ